MKVTSTDVKNSFGKYLRLCSVEPVYITKNGSVIAKLMSSEGDYEYDQVNESMALYEKDRIKMTFEEFEIMNKDAEIRYEYIDGEVYMLTAPSVKHQWIVSRLHIELHDYLKGKPCDVFESPFDVTIKNAKKDWNVVQPDVLVLCNWREDTDENDRYRGIPELVVEVLSPSNTKKEMMIKLNLYMASGIREYWIIDPYVKHIMVYEFEDQKIINTAIYDNDEARSFIYDQFTFSI